MVIVSFQGENKADLTAQIMSYLKQSPTETGPAPRAAKKASTIEDTFELEDDSENEASEEADEVDADEPPSFKDLQDAFVAYKKKHGDQKALAKFKALKVSTLQNVKPENRAAAIASVKV